MITHQRILTGVLVLACVLGTAPALGQGEPPKPVSDTIVKRAERQFSNNEFQNALPNLQLILRDEEYRDRAFYNFMYAECLLETGDVKQARQYYTRAKEIDESYGEAYFGLARTWTKSGPDLTVDVNVAKELLLEAMALGFDVLGNLDSPEFQGPGKGQIQGAQFTRKLLEAQNRFVFDNLARTDPFNVPLDLVEPPPGSGKLRIWNRQKQEAFVRRMEELWAEASRLIEMADQEQVQIGLDRYTELVREIKDNEEMITHPEFRVRLEAVKASMDERKRIIKIKILERYVEQGKKLLTKMQLEQNNKNFDAVIEVFEKELVPLTDDMVVTDEDFRDIAQEILGKGQTLMEQAMVGKEIEALQLEVLGVIIADDVVEVDEEGNETGKHKRATIILNKTEEWAREDKPQPENWPPQRKYFVGNTVGQIEELKIQKIERTKVICLYKDRYDIELELKKREVKKEEP